MKRLHQRAEAFASGHISGGDYSLGDRGALEHGWQRGYQAALTDARRAVLEDIEHEQRPGFYLQQLLKPRRRR